VNLYLHSRSSFQSAEAGTKEEAAMWKQADGIWYLINQISLAQRCIYAIIYEISLLLFFTAKSMQEQYLPKQCRVSDSLFT